MSQELLYLNSLIVWQIYTVKKKQKLPSRVQKYDFTKVKYVRLAVGDGKGYLMIYLSSSTEQI